MDETYIQVKGKWTYFYRAVDKFGITLDFMLSEHRDEAAASAFFARVIENNGDPQAPIFNQWPIANSAIRGTRCMIVSSNSRFCGLYKSLRQSRIKTLPREELEEGFVICRHKSSRHRN
jgi:transposase-like protein